ncbi:hypothetical protein OGATHE_004442 [Ogataea polymorpha]|uniref:Uncharacterized protein n=1 Tax=Ogataea polymorpha TaxID=460523 RepID=A0A9P8T1S7_9ASCO|nr:hypothetical protein OGATHE_004442 [Ogataea polymorpha]
MAVTISGDVRKFMVFLLPSFLARKFLLNEVKITLVSFGAASPLSHWPIQGPHALASTIAPFSSNVLIKPSLSIVARICSDPGVTKKGILGFKPTLAACLMIEAARDMSWYDEFVHEPIKPAVMVSGHSFSLVVSLSLEIGVDKSGVNGPFTLGSSVLRSISIIWSYSQPGSAVMYW